ncbi:MAG: alpha/beta hydrolase [Bdellovibrionota bacterium]|nr:alpha/beta hydrolase [Bdellovibrionota bacterium]
MNLKIPQAIASGSPFRFSFLELLIVSCSSLFLVNCTLQKERTPDSYAFNQCEAITPLAEYKKKLYHELSFNKEEDLSRWYRTPNPSSYSLVVHGLNLKPKRMEPLIKELNKRGSSVLLVALTGHRGSLDEQKRVSWDDWINDIDYHTCLLKNEAKGLPQYSLSFSLGSLALLGHQIESRSNSFSKQVLIAPAAWIKWYGALPQVLSFFSTELGLPSQNLESYRSQDTTSVAAYQAMAVGRELFENLPQNAALFQSDTLIIVDPKDELVSPRKIKKFIREYGLNQRFIIEEVSNREHELEKGYHHLIIDSPSLGKAQWHRLQALLDNFFRAKNSDTP